MLGLVQLALLRKPARTPKVPFGSVIRPKAQSTY